MNHTAKQILNKRALTSLFLCFSLVFLPLSGIPLHFSKADDGAGILRHLLMSIHNITALIFIISLVIHIGFNWKALIKYAAVKIAESFKFKKEFFVALAVTVLIVGLFSSHIFHIH